MKANSRSTLVLWIAVALGIGATDLFVAMWTPGEGNYKSPLAVPVLTFFFLVIVYVVFTEIMRRQLVVEMRGAETSPPAIAEPMHADDPPAPPPLHVEMSTNQEAGAESLHERRVAVRARQLFDQSLAVHRGQVYVLLAANALIAIIAVFLRQPYPISGMLAKVLVGVPLALGLFDVIGRRRARLTIVFIAWFVLHAGWLAATGFVAGSYIFAILAGMSPGSAVSRSAIGLATLCTLTLFVSLRRAWATQQRLRRAVLAEAPVKLLFLWVFGDGQRIVSLLSGVGAVWRCLGPLQFIQGGGMIGMGADVFRYFRGRGRPLIADSEGEVDRRVDAFQWTAGRWSSMYATNTLLCGDRSWRRALERLLDTDVVLMDLCGFSSVNAGCVYEIGQIVNRVPTTRFVFLVDNSTDLTALRATLETAWARMALGSPNRRPGGAPIRLFLCDSERDDKGNVAIASMNRNADRLVDLLCAGLT